MTETKKKRIEARTLKGFRDLLPSEALVKERMTTTLRGVFQKYGYSPIETPHLEYKEVLIGEAGAEIQKQLFTWKDQGERDVALRFDLTVPLARYVVQHKNDVGTPFKRYAIGNVFRGENPQAGRYREFTQCDFDFVGTASLESDVEIVQVIASAMEALGIDDFTIRLNNRKIMNGLAAHLGVAERTADILRIVDKLDKIGKEAVSSELSREVGLQAAQIDTVLALCDLRQESAAAQFFSHVERYRALHPLVDDGFRELERVYALLAETSISPSQYRIDLSIARGLGYYTGIIYETNLNKLPGIGSVCSGGRYDNLTQAFSADDLPGVGASVGLDRLIAALTELKLLDVSGTSAVALLAQMDPSLAGAIVRLGDDLRRRGFAVEVYPDPGAKLAKQFKYADRRGHPYVVVMGAEERSRGVFKAKHMASGSESEHSSVDSFAQLLASTR